MDNTKSGNFTNFGDIQIEVLWPPKDQIYPPSDENNNSVILLLTYQGVSMVLGGDAEKEAWEEISNKIQPETKFFKVPHHGSVNGTFGNNNSTPWLDRCPPDVLLAISCHISPHGHPDQEVIDCFSSRNFKFYRTDINFHLVFHVDPAGHQIKYSRF